MLTERPNLKLAPSDNGFMAQLIDCAALNDAATPAIATQLRGLVGELGPAQLTLDLSGVRYASSAALAMCLSLHHQLRDAGGSLTLRGLCDAVYETFEVTGLTRVLNIERDA